MPAAKNIFEIITKGELNELQQLVESDPGLAKSRDGNGVSALMTAAYYRKPDMVELLSEKIEELDIFEAAALGDTAVVQKLLTVEDMVNSRSGDGFTPLHLAAFFYQPGVAGLLIDAGADVNAVADNPGRVQPLHSAAASHAVEVVRLLLEHGADVNARQHGGWTALQSAAKHGNMDMLEILLQHGADPNQAADDGQTAITMANDDTVRQRLEHTPAE